MSVTPEDPSGAKLGPVERFWRNRLFARIRHHLTWMRRSSPALTRLHAAAIRLSGGRIRRSFVFTGGMPILVLTTVGRRSGRSRSTPVGYLKHGNGFAVLASNAGSDRVAQPAGGSQSRGPCRAHAVCCDCPPTQRRGGGSPLEGVRKAESRLRRIPQPHRAPYPGGLAGAANRGGLADRWRTLEFERAARLSDQTPTSSPGSAGPMTSCAG
jgi:F420H(2)-dependent quinone reductase